MSKLNIKNLIKSFPSMDRPAVNNVNLDIESGELVAFLGPSGCGKTTILKMITGLFQPDSGDIILDEQSLLKIPTEKRGVVMVFPHQLKMLKDTDSMKLKMQIMPQQPYLEL